ncbi:ATP-dependent helicase [Desulfobacterota bacterium M19]
MNELFSPRTSLSTEYGHSLVNHNNLNQAQYEAATTLDGPALVIAGAGSGKTRTLIYRVAYLREQGIAPERILLLTFTRKAAQEMLSRAADLLDHSCGGVKSGTFHAVSSGILRRYGHLLGYTPQFTILDRGDTEGIINLLKSSMDLSGAGRQFPSKRAIANIFGQVVNKNQSLDEIINERYWHLAVFIDELSAIRRDYQQFKLAHNLMDYDDLLVNLRRLLSEFPEAGADIAARFSYIMVDEYQDTNHIQAEIIRLLARPHGNIMAVGDDSQSIYSFRGADFRNIMEFPEVFPQAKIIRLEENYRSTEPILNLTNNIIEHASEKYTKNLFTSINGGEKPIIYEAKNDGDQAAYVGQHIAKLMADGVAAEEIAVLFRSGFHSYKLELELSRRGLAFEKRGGLKLTETAHIKDVISYLRIVYNPNDSLAWHRILLLLNKVGAKTAQRIVDTITGADPFGALAAYKPAKSWQAGFTALKDMLLQLMELDAPVDQFDLIMAYYQDIFERVFHDDYPKRLPDLEQLREIIAEYNDLESFLEDSSLDPPTADHTPRAREAGKLILSTVHSAKGLEWQAVFIINLAEGKFPSGMAKTLEEIEEERRLFYVASTRAKKKLYLVYPRMAATPGRYQEPVLISRFLDELAPDLTVRAEKDFRPAPVIDAASLPPDRPRRIKAGNDNDLLHKHVRHQFFGKGEIVKIIKSRTVQIFFARHGQKIINLDYAKLEILD